MGGFKKLLKGTAFGRWALIPYRYWYATRYFARQRMQIWKWLFQSRELANFTYDLTESNLDCLAEFVSAVTGVSAEHVQGFTRELQQDSRLRDHIGRMTRTSRERFVADSDGKPGKRYLYYALIRAIKPKLIVEAGIEKGFGSCIMAAALERNRMEGFEGRIECIDMSETAGYLFAPPFGPGDPRNPNRKHTGDSVMFLASLTEPIDLFIHDTTTFEPHEIAQFGELEKHLANRGYVCSAWSTRPLMNFAHRNNRGYLVFRDEPKDHWYPGGSLAVVYPRPPTC